MFSKSVALFGVWFLVEVSLLFCVKLLYGFKYSSWYKTVKECLSMYVQFYHKVKNISKLRFCNFASHSPQVGSGLGKGL